jgi:hypothetical protein
VSALFGVILLSACVGTPPNLTNPRSETLSSLERLNRHPCSATVASALDAYNVPPASIRDLFYTQRISTGDDGRLLGYTAWMHLTDQPGSLVIDVDRSCGFEQAYTRGGAELPGVYKPYF